MLNKKLKLNENIFEKEVKIEATRAGFGLGLVEAGDKDENIVVLCADLTESTQTHLFAKKFPQRFFQTGICEQNMAGISAGLGVSGKTVFISSYANFSPGKNWETLRTTVVYNNSNVKIAGHHTGIMTGSDGVTHQATEDIAIMRCLPNLDIFVPCDSIEAQKATVLASKQTNPVYLRFSRDKTPIITTTQTPFVRGEMQEFWVTNNPQATIFATGYMVYYALVAGKELEEEGFPVIVINVSTISPLDEKNIMRFTGHTKAVVTVEDHQIHGGLGSAISEFLSKTNPLPMEYIGLQNTFAESGKPEELMKKYKMDVSAIKSAVKNVIKRKNY